MCLARPRIVPLTGEALGVGPLAHAGSHREELHDRSDYGKGEHSIWGRHFTRQRTHPTIMSA